MKNYTKPLLITAALFTLIGCSKGDTDARFTDDPISKVGKADEGSLLTAQQTKWNFENTNEWLNASQGEQAHISQTSIESNTEAEDGKVVRIYTEANTVQRKKLKTKKQYGAGLYTWRAYISDLGETERVSIGSWLWHSDKHELDFEVGSGTAKERQALATADDEVIAYITSQDNPFLQQKVKIKKNAWHTFQIDLQLVNGNYFATWLIDGVKCAAQQLAYGQEHPFHIFCSTENLKFIGDNWPYQNNYGLWDYVTYTPYSYSVTPTEPATQINPEDVAPTPDAGEAKVWKFNTMPADWTPWTNVGADGAAFNRIENNKLVLSASGYCVTSRFTYKSNVSYGKYTWNLRLPEVTEPSKIQMGGTLYMDEGATSLTGEYFFTIMAWYGTEAARAQLGAKPGQLLLHIGGGIPVADAYVAVLDPNKDYKFSIELKKANNKYVVVYYLDGKAVYTLTPNYGAEQVKFLLITSAESNRGWMPGNNLPTNKKLDMQVESIEYIAY